MIVVESTDDVNKNLELLTPTYYHKNKYRQYYYFIQHRTPKYYITHNTFIQLPRLQLFKI